MSRGPSGPALTAREASLRFGDRRAQVLARAQAIAGLDGLDTVLGTDFESGNDWAAFGVVPGGAAAQSASGRAGVVELTSGAGALGLVSIGAPGPTSLIAAPVADLFYAESLFKLTTASDANAQQTVNLFGPGAANPQVLLGMLGNIDVTHFSWWVIGNGGANAGNAATTIALDLNWHRVAFYADAVNLRIALDGVVVATLGVGVANFPSNPMTWGATAYNGPTAAARKIALDYAYVCVQGNT